MNATRRDLMLGAGAVLASTAAVPAFAFDDTLRLNGRWVQGGFAWAGPGRAP